MANAQCFLCEGNADVARVSSRDAFLVECEICGRYQATGSLLAILRGPELADVRRLLTAEARQATDAGRSLVLTTDNWRELADAHRDVPITKKRRRLLEVLARESAYAGEWVGPNMPALVARIDARNEDELWFLALDLKHRELLNVGMIADSSRARDSHGGGATRRGFLVTGSGWEAVEPVGGGGVPGSCFVAMSFDPTLEEAYDHGIKPAVENDCGYTAVRVDRVPHNDVITDRILAGIRAAQFIVADFTLQRQGVYFEAGFALGLGRPVVWTCRADEVQNSHFDTRQYNHVVWSSPGELRQRLTDRISATIGIASAFEGPS